jgi:hypothetical protein
MSDPDRTEPAAEPDPPQSDNPFIELERCRIRLEVLKLAVSYRPLNTSIVDFADELSDFVFDVDNPNPYYGHN